MNPPPKVTISVILGVKAFLPMIGETNIQRCGQDWRPYQFHKPDLEKVVNHPQREDSELYNVLKNARFATRMNINMCIKCWCGMTKSSNLDCLSSIHSPSSIFLGARAPLELARVKNNKNKITKKFQIAINWSLLLHLAPFYFRQSEIAPDSARQSQIVPDSPR